MREVNIQHLSATMLKCVQAFSMTNSTNLFVSVINKLILTALLLSQLYKTSVEWSYGHAYCLNYILLGINFINQALTNLSHHSSIT